MTQPTSLARPRRDATTARARLLVGNQGERTWMVLKRESPPLAVRWREIDGRLDLFSPSLLQAPEESWSDFLCAGLSPTRLVRAFLELTSTTTATTTSGVTEKERKTFLVVATNSSSSSNSDLCFEFRRKKIVFWKF